MSKNPNQTLRWLNSILGWVQALHAHATYANAAILIGIGSASLAFGIEPVAIPALVVGLGLLCGSLAKPLDRR